MNFNDAVDAIAEHALHIERKSPKTMKAYRWAHRSLGRWIAQQTHAEYETMPITSLTPEMLTQYHAMLLRPKAEGGRAYVPNSEAALWEAINYLCAKSVEMKYLPGNPMPQITHPKRTAGIRELVSDAEVSGLLAAAAGMEAPRERALALALLHCYVTIGLRSGEVIKLRLQDVHLEDFTIQVMGKGSKIRTLPLGDECVEVLREYAALRPVCNTDRFFIHASANRYVSSGGQAAILEKVKTLAGYEGASNIKPHSLRHWFASRLFRKTGGNFHAVMQWLGHSSIRTTEIYLHTTAEQLRELRNLTDIKQPVTPSVPELSATAGNDALMRVLLALVPDAKNDPDELTRMFADFIQTRMALPIPEPPKTEAKDPTQAKSKQAAHLPHAQKSRRRQNLRRG